MTKRMLIDALHAEEIRVVIADENQVYDFDFVSAAKKQMKGNIYLAKITRVEPSLQAAFVEYGGGKQGFLPFSEIHSDYYQIPISDRKRLMAEEARRAEADELEDAATQEQPDDATYGEQPIQQSSEEAAQDVADYAPVPEAPEEPVMPAEAEHPAYLMQGAIDVSLSEEVLENTDQPASDITANDIPAGETGDLLANLPPSDAPKEDAARVEEGVETIPNEEEEYQNRPKKACS